MKSQKTKRIILLLSLSSLIIIYPKASTQNILRKEIKKKRKEKYIQQITKKESTVTTQGDHIFYLPYKEKNRKYLVHIPPTYDKTQPTSLILAFHGGMGNSKHFSNNKIYHFISKADQKGFIIVFPNGISRLKSGKFATWNAGNCCGYAREENVDDVGFVKNLLEDLKSKYNIDQNRIFALGFSNGAMFSYKLACEMSSEFKAIGAVAGTENCSICNPEEPVSVVHIHAENDDHVLFNGGCGPKCRIKAETEFKSVPETVSKWVNRNSCSKNPKRTLQKKDAFCDLYSKCKNNSEVMLCVTETGGHSWPGASIETKSNRVTPSEAISATDIILDFFKKQ